ncbi:DUF3263 domain-containing protein [Arthrobacter sp. Soc17.1.1.1]|uniref:DUF3263 domain-containing protein n=1 Tax=Arthrobacter sp. Soc17.1.1.1 TaxID=3121277 RepID=UPI002FE4D869
MSSTPLTERDQHIPTMAGASYRRQGGLESDIGQLFSMTPTAFYQRVNQLLDTAAALAWNPMLVQRLRAQRRSQDRPRARRLGVPI